MCILFVHTNPQPPVGGYRLIVASNRDEMYKRPAMKLFHCTETNIIGGRDMEPGREGGMWLGLSIKPSTIKFATLLNVTGEEKKPTTKGRGPLVYNYLKSENSAPTYVESLQSDTYSAFNLFMLEVTKNSVTSYHHSNSPQATLQYHGKQTLGFGNSTPDAPFTKVQTGQNKFEEIINTTKDKFQLVDKLLELLKCEDRHLPDPELERRAPGAFNWLCSIFVRIIGGGYGTRTHSIILVDDQYNVEFIEHTMKEPINPENPEWEVSVVKARL